MDQIKSILDLPTETLTILAAGYIGYKIAFTGLNKHHKPTDVVFISLAFGLVAQLGFLMVQAIFEARGWQGSEYAAPPFAALLAVIASSLWRRWGSERFRKLLRDGNISFSDGTQTAWDAIRASTTARPQQLIVRKTDGSQLMCHYLWQFENKPFGPCGFGEDGSVSMYVTCARSSASEEWVDTNYDDPEFEEFGTALTYIPANQIAEIEVRLKS